MRCCSRDDGRQIGLRLDGGERACARGSRAAAGRGSTALERGRATERSYQASMFSRASQVKNTSTPASATIVTGLILEPLPDPRRARVEDDQHERERRENIRADESIELLHVAEARRRGRASARRASTIRNQRYVGARVSTGLASRRTPSRQHSANRYGAACQTPSRLLNTVPNVPMRNSHLPAGPSSSPSRSDSTIEHRRALAFELHGLADDDHEDAEQRHHEIARREIDAARAQIVGARAPFLAQPIAVREHRQRAADAADQRDGPHDRLGIGARNRRHEQAAQHGAGARPERDGRDRDGHEHHADADLHRDVEPAITAAQHDREPDEARQHAEHDLAVRRRRRTPGSSRAARRRSRSSARSRRRTTRAGNTAGRSR